MRMTPENLRELVFDGDRQGLCDAMAPLSEEERKALSVEAERFYKKVDEYDYDTINTTKQIEAPDEDAWIIDGLRSRTYADWRIPRLTAGLSLVGLCDQRTLNRLRTTRWFRDDIKDMPQRTLQILDARRPPWLDTWLQSDAARGDEALIPWFVERGLILSGAIPARSDALYIRRLADGVKPFAKTNQEFEVRTDTLDEALTPTTMSDVLLADPELLAKEIWRFFEVETNAFNAQDYRGWQATLVALTEAGHLDRRRLLGAALDGMAMPFRPSLLGALVKLHDALSPAPEDRAALRDRYLALLVCPLPVVVGCAMKALEALTKAKQLTAEDFFDACPPVLQLDNKAQPKKVIKLTQQFLKADPSCGDSAAAAVAPGLDNPSPDIQAEALGLLEALGDAMTPATRAALGQWTEYIYPPLKPRLEALAGASGESTGADEPSGGGGDPLAALSELRARAAVLDAGVLETAGVPRALACVDDGASPVPPALDPWSIPRRDPANAVAPLATQDELIDAVAAFVEKVDDVMEVERIMDGIYRFYNNKPEDFDQRTAALKKRIEARSERNSGTPMDVADQVGLAQLICCWLGMPVSFREPWSWRNSAYEFLRVRTRVLRWRMSDYEMYYRMGRTTPLPMLALPTHREGWIDPVVLVERMKFYPANRERWDLVDLAQALLRLTPDGRAEAAKLLDADGWNVLKYAFGTVDVMPEGRGYRKDPTLYLAMAHARQAIGAPVALPCPVPGVSLRDDETVAVAGPVADDPAMPGDLLPLVHSYDAAVPRTEPFGSSPHDDTWAAAWQATVWPADRRPIWITAILSGENTTPYLRTLFDTDTPWPDEAARLAALSTGSDRPEVRGLVTDALIEAAGEHRIDPAMFGRHLAAVHGELKLNRLAAVLAEVARISPLNHYFVYGALNAFLQHLDEVPRDLHHLLGVLFESATVTGNAPSAPAADCLKSIKGNSKTGKLARQLLALSPRPEPMGLVRLDALRVSVERGERWSALTP